MITVKDFFNRPWQSYESDNRFMLDYIVYEKKEKYYYSIQKDKNTDAPTYIRVSEKAYYEALNCVKRLISLLPNVGMQLAK